LPPSDVSPGHARKPEVEVTTSPIPLDAAIEKRTIRKLRIRIIPFIFALMVIAFVDRINIGFAALTMNQDLAITSQQFGFLSGIFFWGYFLFEIPSNLLLHKIGARIWIARILISWGIIAVLTGFVQIAFHLYVVRFLLGIAEAGYFPGILLYMTHWFPRRQLAHAVALFLAAVPVSNILGAPLSGVILDQIHWLGLASWRWLLILEGAPAVIGGVLTYWLLPERPAGANFLSTDEKNWLTAQLLSEERDKFAKRPVTVFQTLGHLRVWHLTAIYFTAMVGQYTLTFWMPQLIKAVSGSYSNTIVGLLVMVPYLIALAAMILMGRSSDRSLERRFHGAIPLVIGALALVSLNTPSISPVLLSVVLWSIAASAINSFMGPFWSLPGEFLTGYSAAAGIALINSFGNLGGFFGPYAMGAIIKTTGSFRGGLVFAGTSWLLSAILLIALRKGTYPPATGRTPN
jgi:ACS family tartrate transporter-like MFS transporter